MKIAVLTTLNKRLFENYGYKFFETYKWPFELYVYSEDLLLINKKCEIVNLFERVPEAKKFVERNKYRKIGKTKEDFRIDGVRFSYKVYTYTDWIINNTNYDGLIFIDADSVFYKKIDINWVKTNLYREECMITYLGRGKEYSETGFLFFNLRHKKVKNFAKSFQEMYNKDKLYELEEFHDSWCFDHVRNSYEKKFKVLNLNIGDGLPGHVQSRSILGDIYDHLKGPIRKKYMISPERNRLKGFLKRVYFWGKKKIKIFIK